jgi:2-polyprenyl-3-methyl-5-hydroxy-6-metoxy-1,4-benzoquinol methylase
VAERATRGSGLLEGLLARQRARIANRLIPESAREGALLDVGCGSHPLFLLQAPVARRFGVDRQVPPAGRILEDAHLSHMDLAAGTILPFDDDAFHVVTMLAVIEHIPADAAVTLLRECRRVLSPGGRLILTTPANWTDPLLRAMARLRLVSSQEIDEHQVAYDHAAIVRALVDAGFSHERIRTGTFELFMNLWATADR